MALRNFMLIAATLGSLLLPVMHLHVHLPPQKTHHQTPQQVLCCRHHPPDSDDSNSKQPQQDHENDDCAICALLAHGAIRTANTTLTPFCTGISQLQSLSDQNPALSATHTLCARGPPVG